MFWREQPCDTTLLKGLQNLKRLKLQLIWQPVDTRPLVELKNLETLLVSRVSDFDHLAEFTHLKQLSVECNPEQRQNIRVLAALTNLESLDVSDCAGVSDIEWISGMRNLKRIGLYEPDNIHYEIDRIRIEDPSPIYELPELEKLAIPNIENLDRQKLFQTSKLGPKLFTRTSPFNKRCELHLSLIHI